MQVNKMQKKKNLMGQVLWQKVSVTENEKKKEIKFNTGINVLGH